MCTSMKITIKGQFFLLCYKNDDKKCFINKTELICCVTLPVGPGNIEFSDENLDNGAVLRALVQTISQQTKPLF